MMYASKIKIKREPQKVRYHREVILPEGLLTMEGFSKLIELKEGETFAFQEEEDMTWNIGGSSTHTVVSIHGYRPETQEEVDARVAKEEKYMENYRKHHEKYGRKP